MTKPVYEHFDRAFGALAIAIEKPEEIASDCRWAEGPCWFDDGGYLIWSDIPNNRMLRWIPDVGVSVFRQPSDYINGNTRDHQGRLISCSHGGRNVVRTEPDGTRTVLADRHEGKKLNSPNDVVVKSDGTIWFTDPPYGILSDYEGHASEQEQAGCFVFCLDPATGELKVVADDFDKPNGLAFSPDESVLYVSDSGYSHGKDRPHHIRSFDVGPGNVLRNPRVFAEIDPGIPDGFRADTEGNIWTSAWDGVHCYNSAGALLGKIFTPEKVSNVTFGGPKRNRLFITATSQVFVLYVGISGVQRP
ncbi:MAG: SMP-30/gluconolactonase/LRE family protein [Alphaproteobacteria bacterium]|nr:SMP-30/gluconolactonase/LRE family protein [Alphaproteobacteria bacterium]